MKYLIERERWISQDSPENKGIMRGYDEVYHDIIEADYFGVDEHGTAVFYRKITANVGVGYTTQVIAAYADEEWKTIKESNEGI